MIALVTPLVMSVALWVMTSSPYALALAAFSPLVALAGWLESRRMRRRDHRAAVRESLRGLEEVRALVDAQFDERRKALGQRARARVDEKSGRVVLLLGTGPVPSGIIFDGEQPSDADVDLVTATEQLREYAATIPDAPILLAEPEAVVVVDAPEVIVRSFARSLVLQLLDVLSVSDVSVRVPADEWWARELPLEVSEGVDWEVARGGKVLLRVDRGSEAGPGATLIRVAHGAPHVAGPVRVDPLRISLMCAAEAAVRARNVATRARAAGWRCASDLPRVVAFDTVPYEAHQRNHLAAVVGVDADGPVVFDLLRDGPHALVAGTTGSGKSELLVTWVLALARGHAPQEVNFLLIDFKGGASFAPVRHLPHVVGMVSDLDTPSAGRAVASLRAELMRREELLATHEVRSIDELPEGVLSRLVIVVDEYAALIAVDPALQSVFSDLAARGRTLGLHLILCTQRPAGVVRESVLANVTMRVCLRVLDVADSVAVIGLPDAAALPADTRGRGVRAGAARGAHVQFALTTSADVEAVGRRWSTAPVATGRPWLDPLPARLTSELLPSFSEPPGVAGVVIGALDLPERQRQEQLTVDPWGSGSLLVLGATGSGRSSALEMLAQNSDAAIRRVPDDPAELWQALTAPAPARRVLVIADDLDRTLAWADPDVRADLGELIARAARDTRRSGIAVVASARTGGGVMHAVQAAFEQRLVLRLATREEHLLAGASLASYRSDRRPGSCVWAEREAQLALPSHPRGEAWRADLPSVDLSEPWAVVVGTSAARPHRLTESASTVKGVDEWLSDHSGMERARRSGRLLLVGCTAADHRALTRVRGSLPPLGTGHEAWHFDGAGTTRVRLQSPPDQARPSGDSSAVKP